MCAIVHTWYSHLLYVRPSSTTRSLCPSHPMRVVRVLQQYIESGCARTHVHNIYKMCVGDSGRGRCEEVRADLSRKFAEQYFLIIAGPYFPATAARLYRFVHVFALYFRGDARATAAGSPLYYTHVARPRSTLLSRPVSNLSGWFVVAAFFIINSHEKRSPTQTHYYFNP